METFDNRSISTSTPQDCAELLLTAVPEVMSRIRREMRARRPEELSVPQFRALIFLNRHPGASVSAIAEHLGLALSSTSHLIDGLAKRAYLARETAADDRRRALVSLTAYGQALLDAVYAQVRAGLAGRLDALTPEERRALAHALSALCRIFALPQEQEGYDGHPVD